MNLINFVVDILVLVVGVTAGYFFHRYQAEQAAKAKQDKAENTLKIANEQARLIERQSRESATKIVQAAESEIKERRIELNKETDRLDKRRSELDGRVDRLEQKEQSLNKRQSQVYKRANDIDKLYEEQFKKLEQVAQLTQDEAKKELFISVEKEARGDMARIIRQIEAEAREEGEKRARKLIADAIQRVASEHVAEVTRAVVTLPNEEMKGRIVGRNGRNIKAFEQAAGVDGGQHGCGQGNGGNAQGGAVRDNLSVTGLAGRHADRHLGQSQADDHDDRADDDRRQDAMYEADAAPLDGGGSDVIEKAGGGQCTHGGRHSPRFDRVDHRGDKGK